MNTRKHFGSFSQFHLISKHFVHKRSWSNFFKRKQLFCVIQHERKTDKGTSKSCSVFLTRLTFSFWRLLQCSFLLLFGAKKTHGLLTRWVDCVCSLHSLKRYEAIWSDMKRCKKIMPPWVLGRSLTSICFGPGIPPVHAAIPQTRSQLTTRSGALGILTSLRLSRKVLEANHELFGWS